MGLTIYGLWIDSLPSLFETKFLICYDYFSYQNLKQIFQIIKSLIRQSLK
jgi:hypothetical protein